MERIRYATDEERILSNVVVDENGCWIWQRSVHHRCGYAQVWHKGRVRPAHHVSYETFVGEVPEGLELGATCLVTRCVAPHHRRPGTNLEVQARSPRSNHGKDRCKRGHRFTPENTGLKRRPHGIERVCKACSRGHTAKHRSKEKAS